jgi:hypothetical protein
MYLDENGHMQWAGAHEYQEVSELIAFRDTYREGLPEAAKPDFDRWVAGKIKYEERVAGGMDWQEAGRKTALEMAAGKMGIALTN